MPNHNATALRQTILEHAARTGTELDDDNPDVGAWHLLADIVELYDAEGWDFRGALREIHETLAAA